MESIIKNAFNIDDDPSTVLEETHSTIFELMNEVSNYKKDNYVFTPEDMAKRGWKFKSRIGCRPLTPETAVRFALELFTLLTYAFKKNVYVFLNIK